MENCDECGETGKDGCDVGLIQGELLYLGQYDGCTKGYYFSTETQQCEDASCQLKHCDVCTESGVKGCDLCIEGFYVN